MKLENIKLKKVSSLLSIALSTLLFTGTALACTPQYSGINQVTFNDSKYDNPFAGNGFLIKYNDRLFAVTVKHALFVAKTPNLNAVYIEDEVKEWRIHENNNKDNYVVLGKLLNANKNEPIDMHILANDWLVFEVEKNNSNFAVLELRDTPLEMGEPLTAYGCTYAAQETCSQDEYKGPFVGMEENNLRFAIQNLEGKRPRGLSGSPVLDKNNKLVGIISNAIKSKTGDGIDSAPATLTYLRNVLKEIVN